jgi:hypothetical protein
MSAPEMTVVLSRRVCADASVPTMKSEANHSRTKPTRAM